MPHYAADDPHPQLVGLDLRQGHPSGLDDVFVEAPALPSAFVLPASDGALRSRPKAATLACGGQPYASRVTMLTSRACGLCVR